MMSRPPFYDPCRADRHFVGEQSVQFPFASHDMHVVPSLTVSVFAASSVVTVAFERSPPFEVNYSSTFLPVASATSACAPPPAILV